MLSRRERQYILRKVGRRVISGPYERVMRSRIKAKVNRALEDLGSVLSAFDRARRRDGTVGELPGEWLITPDPDRLRVVAWRTLERLSPQDVKQLVLDHFETDLAVSTAMKEFWEAEAEELRAQRNMEREEEARRRELESKDREFKKGQERRERKRERIAARRARRRPPRKQSRD